MTRSNSMCSWRAGCGESRTSGSAGGGEETTGRKAGTGASPPTQPVASVRGVFCVRPDVGVCLGFLWFESGDAGDAVDGPIEGEDLANATGLGVSDEIGLGEVEAIYFVDLECAQKQSRVHRDDAGESEGSSHEFRDAGALDLIEGLQDIDAFGEDKVGQQQRTAVGQNRGRARGELRRVARQVTDDYVGVDEGAQCCRLARSARVLRSTSSQDVPRLAAGTATVPASARKSGVLATTARERSTRKSSSSPSRRSSASRTLLGIVTCPLDVTRAVLSIDVLLTSIQE